MKREQFNVRMHHGGLEPCFGYRVLPGLIVHRNTSDGDEWAISHESSGLALPGLSFATRKQMVETAREHLSGFDWNRSAAEIQNDSDMCAAIQALRVRKSP